MMKKFEPLSDSRIKELKKDGYSVMQKTDLDGAPWIWITSYGASQNESGREPKDCPTAAEAWVEADRYARADYS